MKKLITITLILLSSALIGCNVVTEWYFQISNLRAGTGIDSQHNITGTAEAFSQRNIIYIAGDLHCSEYVTDLDLNVRMHVYIDDNYYNEYAVNTQRLSDRNFKIYTQITEVSSSSNNLPVGNYYIKINSWPAYSPPWDGGELTFRIL